MTKYLSRGTKKKTICIRPEITLVQAVKAFAKRNKISVNSVYTRAVNNYLSDFGQYTKANAGTEKYAPHSREHTTQYKAVR